MANGEAVRGIRLVYMINELVCGRPLRIEDCMRRFGVQRRTVMRDLEMIRRGGLSLVFRRAHRDYIASVGGRPADAPDRDAYDLLLLGVWTSPMAPEADLRDILLDTYTRIAHVAPSSFPPHRYLAVCEAERIFEADPHRWYPSHRHTLRRRFLAACRALRRERIVRVADRIDRSVRLTWSRFEPKRFVIGAGHVGLEGAWIDDPLWPGNCLSLERPESFTLIEHDARSPIRRRVQGRGRPADPVA